jgi:surface antigen
VSGQSSTWRDAATGDAGDVLPIKTVRSAKYGWCRNATGVGDTITLEPSTSEHSQRMRMLDARRMPIRVSS